MLGVQKFYLYDQGSEEDWKSAIADYIEKGIVEFYDWDLWLKPSTRMQTGALWHCIQNHQEIPWIALIDMDEFLFPLVNNGKQETLVDYLKSFDKENIGQLYVDRLNFGPSGHYQRPKGMVIENYLFREPVTYTPVKSILKPKYVVDTICGGVHTFKMLEGKLSVDSSYATREEVCGRTRTPTIDQIRINHYFSKSVVDFKQKLKWDGNPYREEADTLLEKWKNAVEDRTLDRFAVEVKKKMQLRV